MSQDPPSTDLIAVGIIRKPHGLKGEASVEPWTSSLERFAELKDVRLVSPDGSRSREERISSWRPHGDRALILFEGVASPEAAGLLREWTIEIPASQARSLEEGEYFLHDLIGLELFDEAEVRLGKVEELQEGGGGLLLRVRTEAHGTANVPFAADYIVSMDVEAKRMIVRLPEGLLDLSRAESAGEDPK